MGGGEGEGMGGSEGFQSQRRSECQMRRREEMKDER